MRSPKIILLILSALIGGYGWYWYHEASDFRNAVVGSLTKYETQVTQAGARVKITHGPVTLSGFPFRYKTEIHDLTVTADDIIRQLTVKIDKVSVVADGSDYRSFTVTVPKRFSLEMMRSDIREFYDIGLSESPKVMVSLVKKGEALGKNLSPKRFATVFPKALVLSFQLNDLKREIAFDLAMMQLPIWQNMRYDVGPSLSFFYDILAEAAQRSQ